MQKRLKIVYVDDHRLYQQGVQKCIDPDKKRYFIQKFHFSEEALRYIENAFEERIKIDLVITDYNHLQMNGYEFAKKIREMNTQYNNYTPILLLSMVPPKKHFLTDMGVVTGVFNMHLSKGSECEEIIAAIDLLLNRN